MYIDKTTAQCQRGIFGDTFQNIVHTDYKHLAMISILNVLEFSLVYNIFMTKAHCQPLAGWVLSGVTSFAMKSGVITYVNMLQDHGTLL